MSQQYKIVGPCEVAGVAPGGTVTREQVEAFMGEGSVVQFNALIGPHLEPVQDTAAKTTKAAEK